MRFQFTIGHVPGKKLTIADALSRAPVSKASAADELLQREATAYVDFVVEHLPATEQRLQEIREFQQKDAACQKLTQLCKSGWPDKSALTADVKLCFSVSSQLSVGGGSSFRRTKAVGQDTQGTPAGPTVRWPRLSKRLEELVHNCQECLKAQRQHPQPLTPTPLPELPWQKVANGLFTRGRLLFAVH